MISKRDRIMSDAEIRRRKKLQGHISQTTSTLGLTGLGVTGAAALAARKPGVLRAVQKLPKLKSATPEKMKNTAINTGIVSGGIGGLGGFNFASYTGAESRKRGSPVVAQPKKRVAKSEATSLEMGYYGEEGHQIKLPEIKVPIEKAWSPVANNYDPEGRRAKRAKVYEGGALVGAGAGGAYAAHQGMQAVHHGRQVKVIPKASRIVDAKQPKGGTLGVRQGKAFKAIDWDVAKPALKHGGKTAAGVAAVGAAAGIHGALKRKEKGSWQPYAKRDAVSAFGVDHEIEKSVLSAEGREKIKPKNFAMPQSKSYPIHDRAHARNALARAAQSQTKGSYKAVAAKVHEKFPDIGK
jgi:hypothetical protein